jgi:hypothetical protein
VAINALRPTVSERQTVGNRQAASGHVPLTPVFLEFSSPQLRVLSHEDMTAPPHSLIIQ